MHIDLSEIMSVKGNKKQIDVPLESESFSLNEETYPFAEKNRVALIFTFLGDRKIFMEAKTKLSLSIPCGRCLSEVEYPFAIKVEKELNLNESEEQRIEELDELAYIHGHTLDVEQLIHNEIVILFPIQVLCRESCKGICSKCGKNLNIETCECDRLVEDPRMSAIRDIFNNFKEV